MSTQSPAVLFCANALVPGASAVSARLRTYLDALRSPLRIDALTIRYSDEGHIERHGIARHMRVKVASHQPLRDETFARAIKRQCESEAYAMVVAFDLTSVKAALSLRERFGFEVLFDRSESDGAPNRAEQNAMASVDAIVVASPPTREQKGVYFIPRSVDDSLFVPPTMEVASTEPEVVVVAPIEPHLSASLSPLVKALSAFSKVSLLGPAPELPELKGATHHKSTNDQKRSRILQQSDLVVVLSTTKDTPYATLEALACGRPCAVLAPSSAFAAPQLEENVARTYAKSASAQAQFIAHLIEDRKALSELKDKALRFAQSHEYASALSITRALFETRLNTGALEDNDDDLPFAPSQIVMLSDDSPEPSKTLISARPETITASTEATEGSKTKLPAPDDSGSAGSQMPAPIERTGPIPASPLPIAATLVSMRPFFSEHESLSNGPWINDTVADAGPFDVGDTHSRDGQITETGSETTSGSKTQTQGPDFESQSKKPAKHSVDFLVDALPFDEMTQKNAPSPGKTSEEP